MTQDTTKQNKPSSPAELEQAFVSIINQQTLAFKQNLETAIVQGHDRTPEGLNQIVTYVTGVSAFVSTYDPLIQQFESQGLHALSMQVLELRKEIAAALTRYQTMYADLLKNPPPIATQLPPPSEPPYLSTPAQITAFYNHLNELSQINQQAQMTNNAIRALLTPSPSL